MLQPHYNKYNRATTGFALVEHHQVEAVAVKLLFDHKTIGPISCQAVLKTVTI